MRRHASLALLAVPAAVGVAAVLCAVAPATAQEAGPSIVIDTPVDFVRYNAELPLSGTVFDSEGRRSVRSPVALAAWNANLAEHVWGKTVVTDANGRFRTSVRATPTLGENVLVTPVLGGEAAVELVEVRVPTVPLQYPVSLMVARDAADPGVVKVSGKTLDCEGSRVVVEAAVGRLPFAPLGELSDCAGGVFAGTLPKPAGVGALQLRAHRLPDADTVRSTSPVVTLR